MLQWHLGYIGNTPVWVFLSDDYQMDYMTDDEKVPLAVTEACERIRSSRMRSLKGCQKVLAENGWHNQ